MTATPSLFVCVLGAGVGGHLISKSPGWLAGVQLPAGGATSFTALPL